MVLAWPWKGDPNSAESFEKTLSALSTKVSKASAHNDNLRVRARKLKVSWTLYGGFTYILAFLILTLVTGWRNWGAVEYTAIAGGPLLLYSVRYLLTSWYNYRTSNAQEYLESLYKERDATLEKLKLATKYNSTQQLLEKYGSVQPKPSQESLKDPKPAKKRTSDARVFISPPPTANIPRNNNQLPSSPPRPLPPSGPSSPSPNVNQRPPSPLPSEDFAPNAYDYPQQQAAPPAYGQARWYDRILDALVGDDETLAKNRIALICKECRLVNGLAPPGAKTLEEIGKWRCSGCGVMNGEESKAAKLLKEVEAQKLAAAPKKEPKSDVKKAVVSEEESGNENDGLEK